MFKKEIAKVSESLGELPDTDSAAEAVQAILDDPRRDNSQAFMLLAHLLDVFGPLIVTRLSQPKPTKKKVTTKKPAK